MITPDFHDGAVVSVWLGERFPESRLLLEEFPSGAWMIDLDIRDVAYCIEYSKRLGVVGISRIDTAKFGFEGYDHWVETREALQAHLVMLHDPTPKTISPHRSMWQACNRAWRSFIQKWLKR